LTTPTPARKRRRCGDTPLRMEMEGVNMDFHIGSKKSIILMVAGSSQDAATLPDGALAIPR
ncbi:hypothetical protein, partial [Sphingomonas mollis]|uniref:hypothetical protein n=1 Tax=Sphingomonas mollis TaxID=2795726 RepID=UPI001E394D46